MNIPLVFGFNRTAVNMIKLLILCFKQQDCIDPIMLLFSFKCQDCIEHDHTFGVQTIGLH